MCENAVENNPASKPILILPDNQKAYRQKWEAENKLVVRRYIE